MIDLTTYALLRKQIATAASGISDVRAEGDELVFVLADGHEVRMAIPATEIRDAVVRDDMLVLTLEDDKEVVVDATLTQSGQAADAKVTGDAISQLKDDLASEQTAREEADNDLRADLTANANADAETKRSLNALWKLNQGISYDFQTDAAAAYAKQVPSGAKLASVEEIGGKTVVWNQPWQHKNGTKENSGISITVEGKHFTVVINNLTGHYQVEAGKVKLISGHKYLFILDREVSKGIEFYATGMNGIRSGRYGICLPDERYLGNQSILIFVGSDTENGTYEYDAGVYDLTQLFGSGNEPTGISDSRIAWLEAYAAAHPEYNAGELVSADVESVKYNDAIVSSIPATVRALPGYGWSAGSVANTIERTEKGWRYVQRVSSVDMGTLNWFNEGAAAPASNVFSAYVPGMSKEGLLKNILFQSGRYTLNYIAYSKMNDKEYRGGNGANKLTICDKDYDSADAFKLSLNGENVNFELSEPIITDITSLMEEPFEVEAGGILIFENAAALPVPNSVEYIISLAEVGV